MYEHWKLNRSHSKARRVVADLFGLLFAEPNCLPSPWREKAEQSDTQARARVVARGRAPALPETLARALGASP